MKTKKGIALVMANAEYIHQNKLPACKKDGQDIRDVFEYLNFDVISGLDLKRSDMYELISRFIDEAKHGIKNLNLYKKVKVQENGRLNSKRTFLKKGELMMKMAKLLKVSI